jgi:signal transduction histidine kinase
MVMVIVLPFLFHAGTANLPNIDVLLVQLVLSSITFLIVILIGGVVTLYKLAMPVQELIQGAEAITRGEFGFRIPVGKHSDEALRTLTQAFNVMAEAVQKMREDIESQRQALEETLAVREKEFLIISNMAELAVNHTDLSITLNQALEIIRTGLGQDFLSLYLPDENGTFYCVASSCNAYERERLTDHCRRRIDLPLICQAVETRRVVKSSEVDWDLFTPEQRRAYEMLCVSKFAAEPIVRQDRVLGVLMLMRQHNNPIPVRKAALLHALMRHISVLIENAQLRHELRAFGILEERRRLANDLHDSATQSLFTLNLTAEGLRESLLGDPAFARHESALDRLITQARKAQTEIRSLVNELRPVKLDEDPLIKALQRHIDSLRHSSNVQAELSIQGIVDDIPLPVQRHINRIAQEALSNIARHARAEQADITLTVEPELVTLHICDDGRGFDPQVVSRSTAQSLGLISMRERVEMLGGALAIRSSEGAGTRVTVTIPIAD